MKAAALFLAVVASACFLPRPNHDARLPSDPPIGCADRGGRVAAVWTLGNNRGLRLQAEAAGTWREWVAGLPVQARNWRDAPDSLFAPIPLVIRAESWKLNPGVTLTYAHENGRMLKEALFTRVWWGGGCVFYYVEDGRAVKFFWRQGG